MNRNGPKSNWSKAHSFGTLLSPVHLLAFLARKETLIVQLTTTDNVVSHESFPAQVAVLARFAEDASKQLPVGEVVCLHVFRYLRGRARTKPGSREFWYLLNDVVAMDGDFVRGRSWIGLGGTALAFATRGCIIDVASLRVRRMQLGAGRCSLIRMIRRRTS